MIKPVATGDEGGVSRGVPEPLPDRHGTLRAQATAGEVRVGNGDDDGRADPARLRALVTEHFEFVWRSLLRLGVPRRDAEDALQQVFIIASRKLASIDLGHERAFLFGTALRLASRVRRTHLRRKEVLDGTTPEPIDPSPSADDLVDRARGRAVLEGILDGMPLELRAVFVLFELEQVTMAEIAELLDVPAGTVASRLRRAREHFQVAARRISTRRGAP